MTIRMIRDRRDNDGQIRYVVAGPCGAVEYHALRSGGPLGIEYHSPRPLHDEDQEPSRCDILEGPCYPGGTSTGASVLHREFEAAGGDDEVIWRELEARCRAWAQKAGQ
jgi:hypothetical protein